MKTVWKSNARRLCLVFLLAAWILGATWSFAETPSMVAHYINVGQGDATLLEFPCGAAMIDVGAQDQEHADKLVAYLDDFFARRTDLNRTINVLFVTHCHLDHNLALQGVVEHFTVKHYVDNGETSGSGKKAANWIRQTCSGGGNVPDLCSICDSDITSAPSPTGLTNEKIDPIACAGCDPKIVVLSSRLEDNPGWSEEAFGNQNNQSMVIRVDFGKASFLFTGDMEVDAIDTLLGYYEDDVKAPQLLDVDVYHVGHHGSYNATTEPLLDALTPKIAVISMGAWDSGKEPPKRFSTYAFGHPRETTVVLLQKEVVKRRSKPVSVHVFERAKKPKTVTVGDAIYATGWDGTVDVRATAEGKYRVTTEH